MVSLTDEQRLRYDRNLKIPGIGDVGQEKLLRSRVLIVGLGGLGSPVALYLAAAGVGTLGLLDFDNVDLTNLQRQLLHHTKRLGWQKTVSAAETLAPLNPDVQLRTHVLRLTRDTAGDLLADYDVVVECSDNFDTKYTVNDLCVEAGKPFATAGILALSGQAMFVVPGKSPCLRCAVPDVPQGVPTTAELGVLGAVPGILGSLEAMEVIRYLVGLWTPLPEGCGHLHSVHGDSMRLVTLRLPRRPDCRCAPLWNSTRLAG